MKAAVRGEIDLIARGIRAEDAAAADGEEKNAAEEEAVGEVREAEAEVGGVERRKRIGRSAFAHSVPGLSQESVGRTFFSCFRTLQYAGDPGARQPIKRKGAGYGTGLSV